ncbi:extracellular solute-binding protein [Rubellimicrobium rubrum]|uniref:Extracellular solute-binding protein n=1 Tax=Rubellimicrobium rubrum TaxID=2585369 RepID=A0A5C4N9C8_9RHOB|nr:extracellular solute-binding protein [Rubellimicrobium rubrum]TNC52882.1 extracellular solute-binding protein [Rubellimicrobium rubrum]
MTFHRTTLVSLAALLIAGPALAECGIEAGSVRILSNDFEALRLVNSEAATCASETVTVESNATSEHKNIQVPALTGNPAEYTIAMVANNSIVPLLNDGLIRPLDDLVAEYGQQLQPNQLIKIDGKTMAIAFMANSQHLFFRRDVLEQAGVEPPTTWEGVLDAAKAIKDQGIMEHPLGASNATGWDLAAEFVNMYLGTGAEFFAPGTAELAIDNEQGRATLQMMRDLTQYMAPEYVTFNANTMGAVYQSGNMAIMQQWGSLAGATIDPAKSTPEVVENTVFAPSPTIGGGTTPAAALWWDGFTIAQNISDEDAEASFRAMMHAIRPEVAAEHPQVATWLIAGYEPGPTAAGVIGTAMSGARPYPMVPYMGLLHETLGNELADFIKGSEDADKALADITASYTAAAQQAGFLQ